MNGLDFLNLVIGLIFIYLIYSIAASTIWEIFVGAANLRGKMLHDWIIENFDKVSNDKPKTLGSEILTHPIINGLVKGSKKRPSYISAELFSDVLIDLITTEGKNEKTEFQSINKEEFKKSLEKTDILEPGLKRLFLQYIDNDSGNLDVVKEKIGSWYDEAQERLLGSFKKNLQIWIFVISIILVGATNADTIKIASYLYSNPDASEAIAAKVDQLVNDSTFISNVQTTGSPAVDTLADQKQIKAEIDKNLSNLKALNSELKQTGIPIGWNIEKGSSYNFWDVIKKIGGLLLTVFAVSMGAPFWFDILNKLVNLRSSGAKPKSSQEE